MFSIWHFRQPHKYVVIKSSLYIAVSPDSMITTKRIIKKRPDRPLFAPKDESEEDAKVWLYAVWSIADSRPGAHFKIIFIHIASGEALYVLKEIVIVGNH